MIIKVAHGVLVGVVTCALAGCYHPTLPAPVVFHDGRVNPGVHVAEPERTTTVQLFYATARIPNGKPSEPSYSNEASRHLRLGVATVQFGNEDTTFEQLCAASSGDKDKLPIKIVGMQELAGISNAVTQPDVDEVLPDQAAWVAEVNKQLDRTPNKQINIYVHGCNASFKEEVLTAAPFFHLVGRGGAMIVFDWASRQNILYYRSDMTRARAAGAQLARLVEFLATNTKTSRINVLSYSAGGHLLNSAMLCLRGAHRDWDAERLRRELRVGNVTFAASDLDLKGFATDDMQRFMDVPDDVTVYISQQDLALDIAGFFSPPKLGNPNAKPLSRAELERLASIDKFHVIDVTSCPGTHTSGGIIGHAYWYANEWVMSDVLTVFRWNLDPQERGLTRMPTGKWIFPSDYPQRITQAVLDQAQRERNSPTTMPSPTTTAMRATP